MNPVVYDILIQRVKRLGTLPAMPAVLHKLNDALNAPSSNIDLQSVVDIISYDKSLAAQCLRIANSALFRQRGDVATIRAAVQALGFWRVRDLAFSCSIPFAFPTLSVGVGKEIFWRHALGTAIVAEKLGQQFGTENQSTTYLCGLLHDIGVLVNGILFTEDFRDVLEEAIRERLPIEILEDRILGFTHAESGRILAELWRLPVEIADSIEYHFHPSDQKSSNESSYAVHVADLVCQKSGLGYGYDVVTPDLEELPQLWDMFCVRFPRARTIPRDHAPQLLLDHVASATVLADQLFTPALVG